MRSGEGWATGDLGANGCANTLSRCGATLAVIPIRGALIISAAETESMPPAAGRDWTKTSCGTNVSARGTVLFTYTTWLTLNVSMVCTVMVVTCAMLILWTYLVLTW
jgi:hypothetical protein